LHSSHKSPSKHTHKHAARRAKRYAAAADAGSLQCRWKRRSEMDRLAKLCFTTCQVVLPLLSSTVESVRPCRLDPSRFPSDRSPLAHFGNHRKTGFSLRELLQVPLRTKTNALPLQLVLPLRFSRRLHHPHDPARTPLTRIGHDARLPLGRSDASQFTTAGGSSSRIELSSEKNTTPARASRQTHDPPRSWWTPKSIRKPLPSPRAPPRHGF
jgi:hypothetical protein